MANITLVGERWAVVGAEFLYLGPSSECRDCKVRTVCFNLKEGGRYRIASIRETRHPCTAHEGGVVAVEFEELPPQVAMDAAKALDGAVVTYLGVDCRYSACPHFRICARSGVSRNRKVKVLSKGEELDCLDGRKLVAVDVEEVP